MFLYCITPYKKLECNFIKVGICEDISLLKGRYVTYYGDSCRYYYVNVETKIDEKNIHKKLKDLGLHLENELFVFNKEHDFYFYTKILKEFELTKTSEYKNKIVSNLNKDNIYTLRKNNIFDFIIYIYKKPLDKFEDKKIISYFKKNDIENLWKSYLDFCINNKQFYESRNILKKNIQSLVYYDNPTIYKCYKIDFKMDKIIVKKIDLKNKYIKYKNKMILLLLYQYIKVKRKKISRYIEYMIKVPLHVDIIQNIIQKNKISCENKQNLINTNNKKKHKKLKKKKYIMEYKGFCIIIKSLVIDKNGNHFRCIPDVKKGIDNYIDYNNNKIYDKPHIMYYYVCK